MALCSLENKVALIAGASRGIGAEIARVLSLSGAKVALIGRDEGKLATVAGETNGIAVVCDVTDRDALHRVVLGVEQTLGPIAISVYNAGIAPSATLAETDDAMWSQAFAVNVTPAFWLARQLVPSMIGSGFGRIIHVASNAGLTGYAYTSAYCASKHALVGLTRALAVELARTAVTANCVCPGFVETDMCRVAIENISKKTGRSPSDAKRALEAMNPQKRLIEPREVAHVVLALCSEKARGLNGTSIPIDGGQVMT